MCAISAPRNDELSNSDNDRLASDMMDRFRFRVDFGSINFLREALSGWRFKKKTKQEPNRVIGLFFLLNKTVKLE